MILIRLRNGRAVELTLDTKLLVDGQELDPADIGRIELDDIELSGTDFADGHTVFRHLVLKDILTGIPFVLPMQLDLAKEVGGFLLTGGAVQVARTVPGAPQ